MKIKSFKFIAIVLLTFLFSCSGKDKNSNLNQENKTQNPVSVTAQVETDPVQSNDDAADDPSIWYNEANPSESRIIATNKKSGLVVYNLTGKELQHYPIGKVNNVDIRYRFLLNHDTIDIAGATNRTYNSISLIRIDANGMLSPLSIDQIISETNEVYGFCFYKSRLSGKLFAFLVSKGGEAEQYEISGDGSGIVATRIRSIKVGTQCEGMVADDETGNLFIAEEDVAIWKYKAEPDSGEERSLVADLSNDYLKADLEGLTLYMAPEEKGYLIASSQGNNTYALFNRTGNHEYLGSFSIVDGEYIDGTTETDGIDVINLGIGNLFPYGFFIAQDGQNIDNGTVANQNFKLVDWKQMANAFSPNLQISEEYDFR